MTESLALQKAIDFIENLTADPLLMGVFDVEVTLEDVQAHARIELASIRKVLASSPEPKVKQSPAPPKLTRSQQNYQDWLSYDSSLSFIEYVRMKSHLRAKEAARA